MNLFGGVRNATGLRQAWRLLKGNPGRLAFGLGLLAVNQISMLVLPAASKYVIDEVIVRRRADLLMPLVLLVLAATLVGIGTSFAQSTIFGIAAQRAVRDMRMNLQAHVTRLPVAYFDSAQTGVVLSRVMADAEGVRPFAGDGLLKAIQSLSMAAIALAVLFYLNWRLSMFLLVAISLFAIATVAALARLRPMYRDLSSLSAEISGRLAQSISGIRVVKAYAAERYEDRVFGDAVTRLCERAGRTLTYNTANSALGGAIFGALAVAMIVIGSKSILAGTMTLGDFVVYLVFIGMLTSSLISLASTGTRLTEALASLDRVDEILQLAPEGQNGSRRHVVLRIAGDIEFQQVSFAYGPDRRVLHDLTFSAPSGSTTALVGSSGAGKSTLVGLIMGFNEPQSGRILVDGRDLATVRLPEYRAQLGVVFQDNFLFDGTVLDNIRFSRPHAALEDIRRASDVAHCSEFIRRLPQGYDTVVGEHGVKLSCGERQRVAIARALLADPRILILDEATSNLDSESELLIQDALDALLIGRTTFVIAHRLSTVQRADRILVLEAGRIVERGPHEELLSLNGGRYRRFYEQQCRGQRRSAELYNATCG